MNNKNKNHMSVKVRIPHIFMIADKHIVKSFIK